MIFRVRRDFAKLWVGQAISEVGSRISRDGIPLTALLTLHANALQMGFLSAISSASVFVFALGAGVVVDRLKKRPVMIATDLCRAALLLLVPLAAMLHLLSMTILMTIAGIAGALTVLFDVAYQSYLPVLVEPDELLDSNRRLGISASTAELLGPLLTGVLVKLVTAPIAILLDALSFLVSATSVWAIRKAEPAPEPNRSAEPLTEAFHGLRFIWSHPLLRALLLRSVTAFLAGGFFFTLYFLNATQVVHMGTPALGLVVALGGAGGLIGASLAGHLPTRFGRGPMFFGTAVLIGCAQLLIPLSSQFPRFGFVYLCVQQFFGDMGWMIYIVNQTTLRQSLAPPRILGRVNSAMQLASMGMLPFGALTGGYLASRFGISQTLWIASAGTILSCLWLIPLLKNKESWPAPLTSDLA
ncbi:MAG: MFS transporter [Bryobacteraceae bacterium]